MDLMQVQQILKRGSERFGRASAASADVPAQRSVPAQHPPDADVPDVPAQRPPDVIAHDLQVSKTKQMFDETPHRGSDVTAHGLHISRHKHMHDQLKAHELQVDSAKQAAPPRPDVVTQGLNIDSSRTIDSSQTRDLSVTSHELDFNIDQQKLAFDSRTLAKVAITKMAYRRELLSREMAEKRIAEQKAAAKVKIAKATRELDILREKEKRLSDAAEKKVNKAKALWEGMAVNMIKIEDASSRGTPSAPEELATDSEQSQMAAGKQAEYELSKQRLAAEEELAAVKTRIARLQNKALLERVDADMAAEETHIQEKAHSEELTARKVKSAVRALYD